MTIPTPDPATTLLITRVIPASHERVFSAWTDPARLRQWWGAHEGFTTPIAEVDLRVGGRYRLGMKPPDQNIIFVVSGAYREVRPPEKLVYTWSWETPLNSDSMKPSLEYPAGMDSMMEGGETLVTVEFHDQGSATQVVLTHEYFPDAQTREDHSHGWQGVLTRLAQILEKVEI